MKPIKFLRELDQDGSLPLAVMLGGSAIGALVLGAVALVDWLI